VPPARFSPERLTHMLRGARAPTAQPSKRAERKPSSAGGPGRTAGTTTTTANAVTMNTEQPDHYAVLHVSPHASQSDITHAYRHRLREHHPDTRSPAGEAQDARADATLRQVLAAYTVLRDPIRRARYDRETNRHLRPQPRQPQPTPRPGRAYVQPPIVASPVYWRPAPHEPGNR